MTMRQVRGPSHRPEEDDDGQFRVLTEEEGWELLDRAAQRYLHISAREFVCRWDAGEYEDRDRRDVLRVASLLPFVR